MVETDSRILFGLYKEHRFTYAGTLPVIPTLVARGRRTESAGSIKGGGGGHSDIHCSFVR